MAFETPSFWWKKNSLAEYFLTPLSWGYGYFAARTMQKTVPPLIDLPVLCVGNFTLGGTGKTPLAIALAKAARAEGLKPGIISRGFGRKSAAQKKHIHLIDLENDRADQVGDEPLLLAQAAPVVIGVDRLAAAQKLQHFGVDFIIMDDGFQSRRLYCDYALLTIDMMRLLGNQKTFPAGPLRAPLQTQLKFTDSTLLIGGQSVAKAEQAKLEQKLGREVHQAVWHSHIAYVKIVGDKKSIKSLADIDKKRFFAFAGIGNPDKFYNSIEKLGGFIDEKKNFADHYFFTSEDIEAINHNAEVKDLIVVTTAKDFMRLQTNALDKKISNLLVLDIELNFSTTDYCKSLLLRCLSAHKKRISSVK